MPAKNEACLHLFIDKKLSLISSFSFSEGFRENRVRNITFDAGGPTRQTGIRKPNRNKEADYSGVITVTHASCRRLVLADEVMMMKHLHNKKEVTLQGIVSPAGWGADGKVDAVCIATNTYKYYWVRHHTSPINPIRFIKKEVAVTGTLSQQSGKPCIDVSHIQLLIPHRTKHRYLESREEGLAPAAKLLQV